MSLLTSPLTLPCGLELPNRLAKVSFNGTYLLSRCFLDFDFVLSHEVSLFSQAAMAEIMAPNQNPENKFPRAYSEWADGGWGFIFTG
jgi:hypothetical protein